MDQAAARRGSRGIYPPSPFPPGPRPGCWGRASAHVWLLATSTALVRGLEEWRDRCISLKDLSALSAQPGRPRLLSSPRELWDFLALLTVPFAMCLCPPSGPHRWCPACHLSLQELPPRILVPENLSTH